MINPQLLDYVRAQRAAGLSKDAITQALAAGGWSSQDANEAFMAIEGIKTPPPPPNAAPGPVAPRVITTTAVPGTAINSATPAQQAPMGGQSSAMTPPAAVAPRPIMAASELNTAPVHVRHIGRWILIAIIVLLIFGIGGVAAWVYMNPSVITSYFLPQSAPAPEPYIPDETPPIEIAPTDATTTGIDATTTASTTLP